MLHLCPMCNTRHRGEYDHCERCRLLMMREAEARCAECESRSDDLRPIADGSDLFCTDCRLRLNSEHR